MEPEMRSIKVPYGYSLVDRRAEDVDRRAEDIDEKGPTKILKSENFRSPR
jgi:hypothetical protein